MISKIITRTERPVSHVFPVAMINQYVIWEIVCMCREVNHRLNFFFFLQIYFPFDRSYTRVQVYCLFISWYSRENVIERLRVNCVVVQDTQKFDFTHAYSKIAYTERRPILDLDTIYIYDITNRYFVWLGKNSLISVFLVCIFQFAQIYI